MTPQTLQKLARFSRVLLTPPLLRADRSICADLEETEMLEQARDCQGV